MPFVPTAGEAMDSVRLFATSAFGHGPVEAGTSRSSHPVLTRRVGTPAQLHVDFFGTDVQTSNPEEND